MNKLPTRTLARVVAVLVMIGVACWWLLCHGPNATQEAASSGPGKVRSSLRSSGAADQAAGNRRNRKPAATARENALGALLGGGGFPKPTKEQLEPYLTSRGRSATSLLAAWQITGELELLREAARKEPGNSQALLALAINETTPEANRVALDALRHAIPDNALGDYLLAVAEFQDGNRDAALNAVRAAAAKSRFDRPKSQVQGEVEAAGLTAGLDPLVARALGVVDTSARDCTSLYQVSKLLQGDPEQSQQDPGVALENARMGIQLAERMRQDTGLLDQLVSVSMEQLLLKNIAPETEIAPGGVTAAQRLAEGQAMKDEIKDLVSRSSQVATLSDEDAYHYLDIFKTEGELAALRWLKQSEAERGR